MQNNRIVIVGGGWAGCAAAVSAAKKGGTVILLEKNDRLLGYGLVAGEVFQNGRLTISLEARAMGGKELLDAIEKTARHREVPVPGVRHTVVYDVWKIEKEIAELLSQLKVEVRLQSRVKDVAACDGNLEAVILDNGERIDGKVFVDSTGSAGPPSMCARHGWGCVSCINRCYIFGGRVSLVKKMGLDERVGTRAGGRLGGTGQGVNILKESLDRFVVDELEKKGIIFIPVPPDFSEQNFGLPKADIQKLKENLVLLDNGMAKVKSRPYIPLNKLRLLPGFEKAVYFDPAGGSKGNCVRFLSVAARDNSLLVRGAKNLFVAGEKQGLLVGCCEAIVSGLLAGANAHRLAEGRDLLLLPRATAIGEMIVFTEEALQKPEGYSKRYSCSAGELGDRLVESGLYTSDYQLVQKRILSLGLNEML